MPDTYFGLYMVILREILKKEYNYDRLYYRCAYLRSRIQCFNSQFTYQHFFTFRVIICVVHKYLSPFWGPIPVLSVGAYDMAVHHATRHPHRRCETQYSWYTPRYSVNLYFAKCRSSCVMNFVWETLDRVVQIRTFSDCHVFFFPELAKYCKLLFVIFSYTL